MPNLLKMALFFAMRSCEYLVSKYPEESKRTKIIRLKNVVFKKDTRIIPHSAPLEVLESADLVIITFEFQKFQKNDMINLRLYTKTNNKTKNSTYVQDYGLPSLPSQSDSEVKRVRDIPGSSDESKVCSLLAEDGKVTDINSAQVMPRLRAIAIFPGPDA